MKEYRSIAEWLESEGNPKHHIADGENGSMVIAIESKDKSQGVILYSYKEYLYENGHSSLWMSSGWCVRNEYLPALKGFLNQVTNVNPTADDYTDFTICKWHDEECTVEIDCVKALTETHARIILRNGISSGKYPKMTRILPRWKED